VYDAAAPSHGSLQLQFMLVAHESWAKQGGACTYAYVLDIWALHQFVLAISL
jgi:hypothetical protein